MKKRLLFKQVEKFGLWDEVDEAKSYKMARDIKDRIEAEMQYPGTIKINVIRETRAVEEAK